MELINKKKFAKAALNKNFTTFIVHVAALKAPEMTIYPSQTAKILSGNSV